MTGVELVDGRTIPRAAVFIRHRNVLHADGLLSGLGCDLDDSGFVVVDVAGRTSAFGVWAAGNVVDPRAQVIASAGAANAAAIAIYAGVVGSSTRGTPSIEAYPLIRTGNDLAEPLPCASTSSTTVQPPVAPARTRVPEVRSASGTLAADRQ